MRIDSRCESRCESPVPLRLHQKGKKIFKTFLQVLQEQQSKADSGGHMTFFFDLKKQGEAGQSYLQFGGDLDARYPGGFVWLDVVNCAGCFLLWPLLALGLRSYVPHTKYKTPPNPKIHPESPSKTEIQKKYEKNTKLGDFRIFFVFFLYFWFWRGIWGVFRGVFWGSEGFCILYGARMIATLGGEKST